MRLPPPVAANTVEAELEFVDWVALGGPVVERTAVYESTSAAVALGLSVITEAVSGSDPGLAESIVAHIWDQHADQASRAETFGSVVTALLAASGASDNNLKCQLPALLQVQKDVSALQFLGLQPSTPSSPFLTQVKRERVVERIRTASLSRRAAIIDRRVATDYLSLVLLTAEPGRITRLVGAFLSASAEQREAIAGTLALYQSRGSAAASGGHEPEAYVRACMEDWGLRPGVDFNLADVNVGTPPRGTKTRAYDLVVPYRVDGWPWHGRPIILGQSQYYAGDSGSVSHKNVDQAAGSRVVARTEVPHARFYELVDGAGYVTALSGDLRKLLRMPGTAGFFQLASVGVRLRAALQDIGFATPLEVVHAKAASVGAVTETALVRRLVDDGYTDEDAYEAVGRAVALGWVETDRHRIEGHVRGVAIRYAVLDVAAVATSDGEAGPLQAPGYGRQSSGISRAGLLSRVTTMLPGLEATASDVNSAVDALVSVRALADRAT